MLKIIIHLCILLLLPISEILPQSGNFIRVADLSYIPQIEDLGGEFREDGIIEMMRYDNYE